jgi:hypothetical protein
MEASGQLHDRTALPPAKGPPVPFEQEVGSTPDQSGRHGEVKILDPTGT